MRLPRYYRNVSPIPSAGNAIIPSDLGQDVFREQARAGQALTQLGADVLQKLDEAEYYDQFNQAKVEAIKGMGDYELSLINRTDFPNFDKGAGETILKIDEDTSKILTNSRAQAAFKEWYELKKIEFKQGVQWTRVGEQGKFIEKNFWDRQVFHGNNGDIQSIITEGVNTNRIKIKDGIDFSAKQDKPFSELLEPVEGHEGDYNKILKLINEVQTNTQKAAEEQKAALIDSLKPGIVDVLRKSGNWDNEQKYSKDDTKAGFAFIEKTMDELQKNGNLTDVERVEKQRELDNWLADTVKQHMAESKKAKIDKTIAAYDAFVPKLINGKLTADEVMASEMTEKEKEAWKPILLGSYQDPPKETTYDGYKKTSETIFLYSAGALDKKTAYDDLMKDHFVDKVTSKGDFQSAVNRLNKPYSRSFAQSLQGEMKFVEDAARGTWTKLRFSKGEQQNAIQVNMALMEWADKQIEAGKEPTGKELHAKASELFMKSLRTLPEQGNKLYDLGDTIRRNGKDYEIVGFDMDGMPLVEEVNGNNFFNKQTDVSNIGEQVLNEYPALKNSSTFKNGYQVIMATDEQRLSSQYAKERVGEFYAPGDADTPEKAKAFDALQNPGDSKKAVLEIYGNKYKNDVKKAKEFAFVEALHGMKDVPEYAKLRNELYEAFSPDIKDWLKRNFGKLQGDLEKMPNESLDEMMDRSGTDAFIRAYFMRNNPEYNSKEWLEKLNDKQVEILRKMEKYLKSEK